MLCCFFSEPPATEIYTDDTLFPYAPLVRSRPQPGFDAAQAQVGAPAVFVGRAVHAPALGVDDFKGLDLKGKIAVLFDGAPERFDNDRRAFHSSWREKLREVIARGAIGTVFVNTARDEASWPWAQRAGDWARPAMRLRGDDGEGIDTFPQLRGG